MATALIEDQVWEGFTSICIKEQEKQKYALQKWHCIHTLTVDYQNVVSQKNEEIANYSNKNAILTSGRNVKPSKQTILNEAATILRLLVKMYTSCKRHLHAYQTFIKLVHLMRLIKYHQFYGIFYLG